MSVHQCGGPHQRLVYSVEGAAEQLSISKTVLYELIAAGDISVIHYGDGRRRVGITHQVLVAFIQGREAEEFAATG
jgi:excisionase family DNA binding protein